MIILLLEEDKININYEDHDRKTPLLNAIDKGNMEIIKIILNNEKININYEDRDQYTPLIYAIQIGNMEIIELILKHKKININYECRYFYLTPLIFAILYSKTQKLLKYF